MLPRRLSRKDGQIIVLVGIVLAATVVVAAAASSYMYSVGTEVPTSRSTNILPELLNVKDKFGAALNYTVNQMGIDNISDAFNETLYRFNLIEMKHGIFLDANHDDDWYWVYSGYGSNAAFQAEVNLTISGEYITITKHIRYPLVVNVTGGGTSPPANNPPTCSLSANPTSGNKPLTVMFSMSASDSDGSISSWKLDVDNDGTAEYFGSGDPPSTKYHTYIDSGTYTAKLTVKDDNGSTAYDTTTVRVNEAENQPPRKPEIKDDSPEKGVVGEEYTFTAETDDPDGDDVYYWFDWGDGTNSDWVGPYLSGETGSASHSWDTEGTYYVKVKAQDREGAESEFSEDWEIVIKEKK